MRLLARSLVAALAGAGAAQQAPPPQQPPAAAEAAPTQEPEVTPGPDIDQILEGEEEVLSGSGFTYDPGNRRDPFKSLLVEQQTNTPQVRIAVDYSRAKLFGITPAAITQVLESFSNGRVVSQIIDNGRRFDVMIRLNDAARTPEAMAALAAVVDYESTLQKVANLAVPYFADWSAVDVADADGEG